MKPLCMGKDGDHARMRTLDARVKEEEDGATFSEMLLLFISSSLRSCRSLVTNSFVHSLLCLLTVYCEPNTERVERAKTQP